MRVTIDPELRDLLPAACKESYEKLKAMIEEFGFDPPRAYRPDNGQVAVLIDGHTRFRIFCETAEPRMDPNGLSSVTTFFTDTGGIIEPVCSKDDAKRWILDNQLARRNLTKDMFTALLGERYKLEKKGEHDGGKGGTRGSDGNNYHHSTAESLAAQHGVSEKTVRNAEAYTDALNTLDTVEPGTKAAILSGEKKASQKQVKEAAAVAASDPNMAKEILSNSPAKREAPSVGGVIDFYNVTVNILADVPRRECEDQESLRARLVKRIKRACDEFGTVTIEAKPLENDNADRV